MSKREFKFCGIEVGYFEEADYPQKDGSYRYMPYRSAGHYKMGLTLEKEGEAEIEFENSGNLWIAKARRSEYGILMLSQISQASK